MIYWMIREEGLNGNFEALKVIFNKTQAELKFEHRILEDRFTIEARIDEFLSRGKGKKNEGK